MSKRLALAAVLSLAGFLLGGLAGWSQRPAEWQAGIWQIAHVSVNAARYGHAYESQAERVLLYFIYGGISPRRSPCSRPRLLSCPGRRPLGPARHWARLVHGSRTSARVHRDGRRVLLVLGARGCDAVACVAGMEGARASGVVVAAATPEIHRCHQTSERMPDWLRLPSGCSRRRPLGEAANRKRGCGRRGRAAAVRQTRGEHVPKSNSSCLPALRRSDRRDSACGCNIP